MTSQKVLIVGADGFVGSRLLTFLRQNDITSIGAHLNLLRFDSIVEALKKEKVETIVHLAAVSHVPTCEENPELAFQTNLNGTALLLEAMKRYQPEAHFIFASTAQVYQAPHGSEISDGVVFNEDRAIQPQNLYALTKWQAELLVKDYAERNGTPTTVLRLFNHTHRTQSPQFFLPHLYSTMQKIETGAKATIPVGNLDLERDIGTISDLIQAFLAVIRHKNKGHEVFNVCSGKEKNLRKLALGLAKKMGKETAFVVEESRLRPGEPRKLIGSHQKLTQATGWTPHCQTEEELLEEFLK